MRNDIVLPTQFPPVQDGDLFDCAENYESAGNSRVAFQIYRQLNQRYPDCFADKTAELSARIRAARNAPLKRQGTLVYATDNRGVKYLITSVISFLLNNRHINFKVYILVDGDFDYNNVKAFTTLEESWPNVSFEFLLVTTSYSQVWRPAALTNPTFYRMELPQLVDDKEVLYVDIDTICAGPIDELLDTDITDFYAAGVKAGGYMANWATISPRLQPHNIINYVNAGVLKFNLANIRKDNAFKDLQKLIDQKDKYDQDMINIMFGAKVKPIPLRFNCMTPYFNNPHRLIAFRNKNIYSDSEIRDASYNPVIVHFAQTPKPWRGKTPLDWYYWDAAAYSPFYLDLLRERFQKDPEKAKILASAARADYLQKRYLHITGKPLSPMAATTYTDKIQLRAVGKNHADAENPLLSREYAKKTIGPRYLPKIFGVWKHFRDIPFHELPKKFYLKFSMPGATPLPVDKSKNINFYDLKNALEARHEEGLRQHIFTLPTDTDRIPEIYAEEWLDLDQTGVSKIKLICFQGKVKFVWLFSASPTVRRSCFLMDLEWNSLDISREYDCFAEVPARPEYLSELIELAEKLTAGMDHAVASFYITRAGAIKYDGLATSIDSGLTDFANPELNHILGSHLQNNLS